MSVLMKNEQMIAGLVPSDSGWLTTTAVNGNTVQYRKIGNQVWVRRGTIGTTTGGSWTTIGVLPEGFRPSANVSHCIYSENNGSTYGNAQVLSNGNVNSIANINNSVPAFFFSFLVD